MGRFKTKSDYEELRTARIVENQARLATLGLQKTLSELRFLKSSQKSEKTHKRKYCKVDRSATPLRRSARLSGKSTPSEGGNLSSSEGSNGSEIGGAKRRLRRSRISREDLRQRCECKARGSLYDPVYGICCHFCRQKKLCGEEDCKRCGDRDLEQPCIGKTDCSVCHSSNGVLCRACLKIRYGEEMEEVRMNKEWMCPHCIEEKGTNLYWICNSSFCMKKRKMIPTGIAIYRVRTIFLCYHAWLATWLGRRMVNGRGTTERKTECNSSRGEAQQLNINITAWLVAEEHVARLSGSG